MTLSHTYLFAKKTRRAAWYAMLALGFSNTYYTTAHNEQPEYSTQESADDANPINIVDVYITQVHKAVAHLNTKLIDLASMISNNQVPSITNKEYALNAIRTYVMFLNTIEQEQFLDADGHVLYDVLHAVTHFTKHLDRILSKGTCAFEPFDLSDYQLKSPLMPITLDDIDTALRELNEKIAAIENKIDSVGLQWYNKAYRQFDNYVINPCQKHQIPYRVAGVSATALGALTLWWLFANNSFNESTIIPEWVKKSVYGPIPGAFRVLSQDLEENVPSYYDFDSLKFVGKADTILTRLTKGTSPILAFLLYRSGLWADSEMKKYGPKISNAIEKFHNRMKGGIYNNVAQRLDSNFISNVYFEDIIGSEDVIEEFKVLIEYMSNPESFDRAQLSPHKGILLEGDSRTGKTFCVTALANEMKKRCGNDTDLKFIQIDGATINQFGISYLMTCLKNAAPCIVFIDEIDLLALQRTGTKNDMLNEFLTCMSGALEPINPKKQVILIAATNKPENLDFALLKPGRFGKRFHFSLPTIAQRKLFIIKKLQKLSVDITKFDIDSLAYTTENQSYQGLGFLISRGLLKARLRRESLAQKHLEEAINEDIRGIDFHEKRALNERECQTLATHFAGHAIALHLLDLPEQLSCVTIHQVKTPIQEIAGWNHLVDSKIKPAYEQGKVFTHAMHDTAHVTTYEHQIARCKYLLAGIAAEEMFFGKSGFSCCHHDTPKAMEITQAIVMEGLDFASLPPAVKEERFKKAEQLLRTCKEEVKTLLNAHREELTALIELLKKDGTVYSSTIQDLLHKAPAMIAAAA